MSANYRCPYGHRWQLDPAGGALAVLDCVLCPECGSPADTLADHGATGEFAATPPEPILRDSQSPIQIAGYEILGELGRGGMGVVYKARQLRLKRLVALKMIRADAHIGDDQLARFKTEAEAAARLQHPNIVQIYEVGEWSPPGGEPRPYMALEFVPGVNLDKQLRGSLPVPEDAANLVALLAGAIEFAHERNVIHRDLKPANVLIASDGMPKIADFGLAKQLDTDSGQTQTGAILGTPSYMAPEQARGDLAAVGPRTDVYALGAILYESLTGRPPFRGSTAIETFEQVQRVDPVPPGRVVPGVPRDLETICLQCLRKEPADRYRSAAALADDLRRFASGEPIRVRPLGRGEKALRWARRRKQGLALVGSAAVLVIAMSIVGAKLLRKPAPPAPEPETVVVAPPGVQKLAGHKSPVFAAVFSKDGQHILTGSGPVMVTGESLEPDVDASARVWDTVSGRESANCRGLAGPVMQVAFGPTPGRLLTSEYAIESQSGIVREWDAATGRELRKFTVKHYLFTPWTRCAFSSDGSQVASASESNALVYDARTGQSVQEFPFEGGGPLFSLAFSPDATQLAAVGNNRKLYVWRRSDAKTSRQFPAQFEQLTCVGFFPDGRQLLLATDKEVRLVNLQSKDAPTLLFTETDFVGTLAVSLDGTYAATGSALGGVVHLWDLRTRKLVRAFDGHSASIMSVAFSPDGKSLLTTSIDTTWRVWDIESGREVKRFGEPQSPLGTQTPPRMQLGEGTPESGPRQPSNDSETGNIRGEIRSEDELRRFTGHENYVYAVGFDREDKYVVTAGGGTHEGNRFNPGTDCTVRLWDRATGDEVRRFDTKHKHAILALEVSPFKKGFWLATGGWDGMVILWNGDTGKVQREYRGHTAGVTALAFHPSGTFLASCGWDKTVRYWRVNPAEELLRLDHPEKVVSIAISRDGHKLLAACGNGRAYLWDLGTGKKDREFTGHKGEVWGVAFAPDGSQAVTGGADGTIRIWEVATGRELRSWQAHERMVSSVAISPDGNRILSGGQDRCVRLWDAKTGAALASFAGHTRAVTRVVFDKDGKAALSGSYDRTASMWRLPNGD